MRQKSNGTKRRQSRRNKSDQSYGLLEARNLLATLVSVDASTGLLSVTLDSHEDVAAIGVEAGGNVTVNGSEDLDSTASGIQTLAESQLRNIKITGDANRFSQEVSFNDVIGQGQTLTSVDISAVNQITINGSLTTTGNFIATLSGTGGQLTDSTTGQLVVGAGTFLDAGANKIQLDNASNDFALLRLRTLGDRQDVAITDVNDIMLTGIETSGNFVLEAAGAVEDAPNTRIAVTRDAQFTAGSLTLGDHSGDNTNFFRSGFQVVGHVELHEDSNTVLTSSDVGTITIHSVGAILDGSQTTVNVGGTAQLFGGNRIRVGDGDNNTFNAGTVEFRTNGQARIFENSTLRLIGENSATTAVLHSDVNITNAANTKINVSHSAEFVAENIVLGTRLNDEFNVGTLKFSTTGNAAGVVRIAEDSSTLIGGNSNANSLRLTSSGSITDTVNADISVTYNSQLTTTNGGRIIIGDAGVLANGTSFDSKFETRTLTVKSDGNIIVEEEGDIILTGENQANSLTLKTRGAEGSILDTPETQVDVRYNLNVVGGLVNLGTAIIANGSSTDRLEFSTLTVNSTGNVNVSADDTIILTGRSNVGGFLTLESEGDIRSTNGSEVVTEEGATFEGMDIFVGNLSDDCFDIINSNEDGTKRLNVIGQGTENVQLGCTVDSDEGDS